MNRQVKKEIDNAQEICIVEIRFSNGHHDEYPIKKIDRDMLINSLQHPTLNPFFRWESGVWIHRINLAQIAYIGYEKD